MADHGGLMVAGKDESSNELMYSCSEGHTWHSFRFPQVNEEGEREERREGEREGSGEG